MKHNLKTYRGGWTHLEKDCFISDLIEELQQLKRETFSLEKLADGKLAWINDKCYININEVLGETT